jgi:hypothetical protein
VLRLQLENLAELDVETAGEELRRNLKEVPTHGAGERVLSETRDRLLLPCSGAELQLGTVRFLDPEPAKPLGSQDPSFLSGP